MPSDIDCKEILLDNNGKNKTFFGNVCDDAHALYFTLTHTN